MDDKKKEEEKKKKKLRSISVTGVTGARKVSFAKKSSSDNDVTKHDNQSKRRTKSADLSSAASNSALNKTRQDITKPLFSISEHIDGAESLENPTDDVNDDDTVTTELPISTTDETASFTEDMSSTDLMETVSELPETRENSARVRRPRRVSSVASSETSSVGSSSMTTLSGPSSRNSVARMEGIGRFRRPSSTQQNASESDMSVKVMRMALRREWTQLELNLRYMNKGDPGIYVTDEETGMNPLMLAARDNRIAVVERLIDMGVNVNEQAKDGQSAVHFAVSNGREEIVNLLIRKKADMSLKGGDKEQIPLHLACARSGNNAVSITQAVLRATNRNLRLNPDKDGNIPLFLAVECNNQGAYRELLSQYAEEQLRYQNPKTGDTVLHIACEKRDAEMVRLFCKKGSLVNIQNKTGTTALHTAASMGDALIVECLYSYKADANILDNQERTPLHVAAEKGHTAVVDALAERFPKTVLRRTQDGSTLMHIASEYGHPETALAFLKKGVPLHMPNKSGAVCLHSAAKNNHVDVVATLLKKGAHVDARTKDKLTALHVAVKHCRPLVVQMLLGYGAPVQMKGGEKQETPLHLAAQISGGELVAEMLIKSGADVNSAREDGETAVHMASRKGNLKTFKLLLDEKGDARMQSKAGENALHIAVRHCRKDIAEHMLKFLETNFSRYEATLCVNMENKEGETPMHMAAELTSDRAHFENEELELVSLLLSYGGDINFCTKLTQETPLHYCARAGNELSLKMLLEHVGKDHNKMSTVINRPAKNGWSPLLFASDEGHEGSAEVLLGNSARVDVFDENSKAALHLAAENGHDGIARMLIQKKAYVNAKTKLGLTPLHLAAHKGYNNLVKMLINPTGSEQKATIDALTLDNKTPLHKASENGKIEVCETLLDAGAEVEAIDSDGQTPLHLAAENDHSNVVKMFLGHRKDLVMVANKNGATCAHIAASKGSVAVIRELLNSNKESVTTATNKASNSTSLHIAASRGHAEVVRELILNGASLIEEDSNGMNALHLSAKYGHSNIIEVILSNRAAIQAEANLPLKKLWQIVSSKSGFNVLHVATKSGNENFAREMLHRIRAAEPSEPPGIKLDNARDTAKDYGFTPLHLASHSGHVSLVRMILNYPGVSVDACTVVQRLTPLHLAAKSGFVDVVHLLLSKSISQLRCADAKGFTCLHYAAAYGHVEMASLLLGQGARIESRDNDGMAPLHLAAKSGSLKMVKLLTEAGASSIQETKHDKKVPIQFAAASRHIDVVSFLIHCEHDTRKLVEDKTFVADLMMLTKSAAVKIKESGPDRSSSGSDNTPSNKMEILEEFIMTSSAPVEIASKLSKAFVLTSNREKEQSKALLECADYCEQLAVELLEICSASNGANEILRATDQKSNPFLDVLIECEQKSVIANPAVQKYLSDVWLPWPGDNEWNFSFFESSCHPSTTHGGGITLSLLIAERQEEKVGNLNWANWKFVFLFLAILCNPILWLIFSLPLHWRLNRTPIIKFLVYLVSHLYLVTLFIITVAIPITPIYMQADLIPEIYEWLLLVWVTGELISELTSPGRRTGIARIRYAVLVLCALAVVVHLIALAFANENQRLEVIYIRNIILSAAMTCAVVQLLEFLSFHYLFGPWSIIIEGLLNDLIKFGVIVLLFMFAFTMWLAAVYQPVYSSSTDGNEIIGGGEPSGPVRVLNPGDTFQILFFALFGLIEPDNLPPINRNPLVSIFFVQIVFGIYHIITLIVLINLLIAMMSDTYQRIQAQSDTEWKFGRAKLIRNMKKTSLSPAPINLFITAYQYAKLLIIHKGRACDVGMTHSDDEDEDSIFQQESSDVMMNHAPWSNTTANTTVQSPVNQISSDMTQPDSYHRRFTTEGGRKESTLEIVVDWKRIRQKYWSAKGKQRSSNDLFSGFISSSDVNYRATLTNGSSINAPKYNYSQSNDGVNFTSESSPHSVPYGDEVT